MTMLRKHAGAHLLRCGLIGRKAACGREASVREALISSSGGAHPAAGAGGGERGALRERLLQALRERDLSAAGEALGRLQALSAEAGGPPGARARELAELGDLWSLLLDYSAAEQRYTEALALAPQMASLWFNRAAVRRFLGQMEEAEADYDRAIALAPTDAQAYLNRSELRPQTGERNHVEELERVRSRGPADWRFQVPLRYALAKEYEDLGQYATAWQNLSEGARLRRRHLQYDVRVDLATVEWIRQAFPRHPANAEGEPSSEPIFILGMPRTGSTLIDRMLGSHSQVFCAGELTDFGAAVVAAVQRRRGGRVARQELVTESARLDFTALGQDYLRRTRPRTGHTPHFTDKLPLNYLYCGLIARALPGARMVHVTRGPMASCYGMYKVLFDQGYPFSYDLTELADYYIGYRQLMAHWRESLQDRLIEIAYEDLVADPEGQLRRLLGALGLPWQEQCLRFERNAAPVATASAAQVRRPIYASAVSLWRHYERELAPLAARLQAGGVRTEAQV